MIGHFAYVAEEAGLDTAERFLARVGESFEDLARMPLKDRVDIVREIHAAQDWKRIREA